jgi:hypothetical protein
VEIFEPAEGQAKETFTSLDSSGRPRDVNSIDDENLAVPILIRRGWGMLRKIRSLATLLVLQNRTVRGLGSAFAGIAYSRADGHDPLAPT